MLRLPALLIAVGLFAGCERSNRNIEVQPVNNNIKPNGQNGDSNSNSYVFTTGSLKLRVSGLPSSASSAVLKISIDGNVETRNVSLSSGAGVTTVTDISPGEAKVDVNTVIGSTTYYGTTEISIIKGMISSASIVLGNNSNPAPTPNPDPQPTPMPQPAPIVPQPSPQPYPQPSPQPYPQPSPQPYPQPQPTPNNNGGSADIDIGIDIGGNSPTPTPTPTPQNVWDGQSFQGNNMFSIEPLD